MVFAVLALSAVSVLPVAGQGCNATLPPLPPEIANAKAEIISLSKNNLDRWGDPDVQALINVQAAILENWFIENRPDNEVELTVGPWFAAWYEDISFFPNNLFLSTDRNNTYQVVRDGFYYNVAKFDVGAIFTRTRTNYLKGEFTIKDPKTESSCGEKRRNILIYVLRVRSSRGASFRPIRPFLILSMRWIVETFVVVLLILEFVGVQLETYGTYSLTKSYAYVTELTTDLRSTLEDYLS